MGICSSKSKSEKLPFQKQHLENKEKFSSNI